MSIKGIAIAASLAAATLVPMHPANAGPQPFVGEIEIFPFNFCPSGFLPADGRLLPKSNYAALYDLIGTTYGGDGIQTFALPKLKVESTANTLKHVKLTKCIAILGIFPSQN